MISAIILAAGQSKRMGQPKMLMTWGSETVLSHVILVFRRAGVDDIYVITGGARAQVEMLVSSLGARSIFNEGYAAGEMLSSIQCGIKSLPHQTQAVLIGLGDQPQVQEGIVQRVCDAYHETNSNIIVPSYQMRRGHPWLVAQPLWGDLLKIKSPQSPRDFLNQHADQIKYVDSDDPYILADLDTPDEYQKWTTNTL